MAITSTDISFSPGATLSGPLVRDILSRLVVWTRNAAPKHRQMRRASGLAAVDDHLLRDIGLTRLGISEAELANHNEAG